MPKAEYIDNMLLSMLRSVEGFSRLNTCLCVRLSDYAAQLCGCRSARQIDDNNSDDVETIYSELLNSLHDIVIECISILETPHVYNNKVISLTEDSLEEYLEDTLYYMTTDNTLLFFNERFFA